MKTYIICKYNKNCSFKQIKKRGRLWYPTCTFKGTCNQQLTLYKNTIPLIKEENLKTSLGGKLVFGGLHRDDFEWAAQQYEALGYILVAFLMERDGYHWKAVYVKADQLEKRVGGRGLPVSVSLSADAR